MSKSFLSWPASPFLVKSDRTFSGRPATGERPNRHTYLSKVLNVLLLSCLLLQPVQAAGPGSTLPVGGGYVAGSGTISTSGNQVKINQSTFRGVIDWTSFSIGAGGKVIFNNGRGATLNRVTGGDISNIFGSLSATGTVYLINPRGILVGNGARINTGGDFLASTLQLAPSDFMKGGALLFNGDQKGFVVNLGNIYSTQGSVFLLGGSATNRGSLNAADGEAGVAGGSQILLKESNGDQRIFVQAPGGDVTNSGTIQAAQAELKSKGGNIYALAGNESGLIQATGVKNIDGQAWLIAEDGTIDVGGQIVAKKANGSWGHVETSGEHFKAEPGLTVKANWLTDPTDLTIDATLATAIDNALNTSGDYTATTLTSGGGNGDILVTSNLQWTSNSTLTLSAYRNISLSNGVKIINGCPPSTCATLNPAPSGGLILRADNSGTGTGTLLFGNSSSTFDWRNSSGNITLYYDPTGGTKYTNFSSDRTTFLNNILLGTGTFTTYMLVNNTTDLNDVSQNLSANFALGKDIDASGITTGNFTPIGATGGGFSGAFDGMGQIIDSFHYADSTYAGEGLFSTVNSGAIIRNLGLTHGDVSSTNASVGMLAGVNQGSISNVWVQGQVSSTGGTILNTGGLVGSNSGSVSNVSADVKVSGPNGTHVGGLLGLNTSAGSVSSSYSKGIVTNGDPFAAVAAGSTETNDYFDTTTSGLSTSVSAATGLTHNSLSNSLPNGFSTTNWGIVNVSDPYLKAIFKTVPSSINGTYASSQGGSAVTNATGYVVTNGNTYLAPYAGANGSFTLMLRAIGGDAFGYTTSGITANSYLGSTGANPFGNPLMKFYDNTVTIAPGTSSSSLGGELGALTGITSGVSAGNLLFTIGSSNSSFTSSKDVIIDGSRNFVTYSLNRPLTTTANLYLISPQANPLTQTSPITANGLAANGQITLTNTSNAFNTLGGSGTVNSSFYDANNLTVGTVGNYTGYNGQYTNIQTAGNLTLNASVGSANPASGSAPSIRLIDGGTFTNNVGAGALANTSGTSGWSWQIWSQQPANDNLNGLYWDYKQYNATYGVTSPAASNSLRGVLYTQLPYLTVSLTGQIEKTYDSTNAAYVDQSALSSSGYVGGDTQDQLYGTGSYTDIHAGTGKSVTINSFTITATNLGRPVYGYQTNSVINSNSGIIDPAPLNFQINSAGKTYDGTTADPGAYTYAMGLQGSDSIVLSGVNYVFDSKDVAPQGPPYFGQRNVIAVGTPVLVGQNGTLASDYALGSIYQDQNIISPAPITIPVNALSKTYDGTAAATATLGSVVKLNSNDDVSVSGPVSATFSDQHAGTGKTVTVDDTQLSLAGNQADDYYIASGSVTGTADINPLAITATLNHPSKVFDNTTSATVTMGSLQGVLPIDAGNVTAGGSPVWSYAQAGAGSNIQITQTGLALSGPAASDYTLNALTTTGNITPAPITATIAANNKTYDGTINASGTVTLGSYIAGAPVSLGNTGTLQFDSKNVGSRSVTDSGETLSGANANNYSLTVTPGSASISPATATIQVAGAPKDYDTTTADPGASYSLSGIFLVDLATVSVTGTPTYAFASPNAGHQNVGVTGLSLTGADANNYTLTIMPDSTKINPANVTLPITAQDKTFDNTTNATVSTGSLQGVFPQDVANVVLSGSATWQFATANAGTNIPVTGNGLSLTGSAASNYNLPVPSGSATINPAPITATLTANNKVYDSTTAATGTLTLGAGIAGAPVSIGSNGAMTFASPNVNTGIQVTDTTATLSGVNANNYSLTVSPGTANITPAAATLTVVGADKIYDSFTTDPGASFALTGVYPSDVSNATVAGTASYALNNPNVGSRTVSVSGLSLTGSAASNYSLSVVNGSANISPAALSVPVTVAPKTFDNTTSASATYGSLQGVAASDAGNVTLTGSPTWSFTSVNAGPNVPVTGTGLSLSGSAISNYILSTPTGYGVINPAPITATLAANNKVYDSTTAATGTLTLGTGVPGAPVSIGGNGTMTFASPNVQTGIQVTDTGATLTGANANNYALTVSPGSANIIAAPVTLTVIGADKVYDTLTTDPGATSALTGVYASDLPNVTVAGTAYAFNNPNAGSQTVTVAGASLSGSAASNYSLNVIQPGTANITPAPVTLPFTPSSITYNGSTATNATIGTLTGILGGQNISLAGSGSFNFSSPNAGTTTVMASGYSLTGPGASNYALNLVQAGTASISPAPVTLPFTPNSITYNGGTATTATLGTLSGILAGQNITLAGTGSFNFTNPNAGSTTVNGSGFSLAGLGASNYTLTLQQVGSASITPAPLTYTPTLTGATASRSFGQPNPTFTGTVTGIVNNAPLSTVANGTPTFTTTATPQSPPGTYAVVGSGLTLANPNYVLAQAAPSPTTTFTVQPIHISIGSLTRQAGQPNPTFSINYSGPATPYLQQVLSSISLVSNAPANNAPGTYQITAVLPANLAGSIIIDPGTLIITPDSGGVLAGVGVASGSDSGTVSSAALPAMLQTAQVSNFPQFTPAQTTTADLIAPNSSMGRFQITILPETQIPVQGVSTQVQVTTSDSVLSHASTTDQTDGQENGRTKRYLTGDRK